MQKILTATLHCLLKTFFVDRKLYGNMREGRIDILILLWFDSGIVTRVFIVLRDGTDATKINASSKMGLNEYLHHADIADDL
jgi:hypothetical protein